MKKILSFVLALCMICTLLPAGILTTQAEAAAYTGTFEKYTGTLTDGYYLFTYKQYAMKATVASGRLDYGTITSGAASVTDPDESLVWKVTMNGTTATLYNESVGKYAASTGAKNKAQLLASGTDNKSKWTVSGTSTYEFVNVQNKSSGVNSNLRNNGTYGFACYATGTGGALTLYKLVESAEPACEHENREITGTKAATCTVAGETSWVCEDCGEEGKDTIPAIGHNWEVTGGYDATCTEPGLEEQTCANCGDVEEKEIPVVEHNYVDGFCDGCGAEQPNEVEATINFATTTQRTAYDTSKQVWEADGVIFTNNKSASTTNVGNYSNPVRLYAKSQLVFTTPEGSVIKEIIATTVSGYNALKASAKNADVVENGNVVTIVPNEKTNTYTIDSLTAQTRFTSLTIVYELVKSDEEECQHTNTEAIPAKDATCTEPGNKEGLKCSDCGEVLTEAEEIPATGHTYENGVCTCGAEKNALVTSVDDLKVGDRIVIVAKDSGFAMSTNQKDSNRGVTAVKKDGDMVVGTDMQVLTLKAGMVDGTFALYTGSGYLYASSSSANQLKTDDVKTANGSWMIEIAENGTATIKAQGDSERNWLRYNDSSSLFACYASGQKDVVIYKLVNSAAADAAVHTYVSGSETVAKDYANLSDALKATKGTITMLQDATVGEVDLEDTNVVLNLNGYTLTADAITASVFDTSNGKGLIKTDAAILTAELSNQLILWDNTENVEGYRVFDAVFASAGMNLHKDDTDVVKSFWSDLDFTNTSAYQIAVTSGLNFGFTLNCNGAEKTFWFDEDTKETFIKAWSDFKCGNSDPDWDSYCYVTVTGFENLDEDVELRVTPLVKDYSGKVIDAEVIEFSYVAE